MSGGLENDEVRTPSWWEGWVQSAKEKSASVLSVVKQDLVEFSSVMQCDGSRMACAVKEKFNQETAASASKKVKQGMSSLWGELSKALVIPPEDDDCYEIIKITDGKPVAFDRAKAQLNALQTDVSTYTVDPGLTDEKFHQWVESNFDLEEVRIEISDLLVSNANIRSLYTLLVPLTVSNVDFWCRYFYKKHLLDEDENRRIALVKRAQDTEDKHIGWDEDEDVPLKESNTEIENTQDLTFSQLHEKHFPRKMSDSSDSDVKEPEEIHAVKSGEKTQTTIGDDQFGKDDEDTTHPSSTDESMPVNLEHNLTLTDDIKEVQEEPNIPSRCSPQYKAAGKEGNIASGSASGNASNTESLTDDWEKVYENEVAADKKEAPSESEAVSTNDDWEEW